MTHQFPFIHTESCATARCGANRRCIVKQGQPKCICAPNCKHRKDSNNKSNGIKLIGIHQNFKSVKKKSLKTSSEKTYNNLNNDNINSNNNNHNNNSNIQRLRQSNSEPNSDKLVLISSSAVSKQLMDPSNNEKYDSNNILRQNIRHKHIKLLLNHNNPHDKNSIKTNNISQNYNHRQSPSRTRGNISFNDTENVLRMTENRIRLNTFLDNFDNADNHNLNNSKNFERTKGVPNDVHVSYIFDFPIFYAQW